ncbi:Pentatricopeptide repeat-containing protein ELI1 chloroplastic [Zea mays]|uniref:Pentatricopeptide repeat-containing protein ELI1 chloroplastic n=1 Tax=Zea mays TaxID=4577 RepID=A0A1D6HR70_MAIZE|nr:Pentatricopeptide repeat-containing protein ELI1 chloroplastic [Zea mays]
MDGLVGLLKVRVVRGINLAYRDARGSDPYVVLRLGKKKLKTSVKKRSVNPIWHEELTLTVTDPSLALKLTNCLVTHCITTSSYRRCSTRTRSAGTTRWGTRRSTWRRWWRRRTRARRRA